VHKFNSRILSVDSGSLKDEIFIQVNPTEIGAAKVSNKGIFYNILIQNVKSVVANVIKQEMLSVGGDAAVARGALDISVERSNVVIVGNLKQLKLFAMKIKAQPFSMKFLGSELLKIIDNFNKNSFILKSKDREIHLLPNKTYIMGILNATPDSFSDGGDFTNIDTAIKHVEQMLKDGADFIDIGGESTRPGAENVSVDEELRRVIPLITLIKREFPDSFVSIDTYKAKVAEEALIHGADIINDISALKFDNNMFDLLIKYKVPAILMHIKGTPSNMQVNPTYHNLINEISNYFREIILYVEDHGGDPSNLIIDPGIGFGKTFTHNLEILNRLKEFKSFGLPILIGTSRKSFIGKILNRPTPKDRINGSIASACIASSNGAKIIRTHDVQQSVEALKIVDSIRKEGID